MKRFSHLMLIQIPVLLLVSSLLSCTEPDHSKEDLFITEAPDYAVSNMWYRSPKGEDLSEKEVDVFYVTPTCIWDWKDESGQVYHYMNVSDSLQRAAVDGSNYLAYRLFEKSCNFYSPYYRQISMECWFKSREGIERLYEKAQCDVVAAYHYYMEHFNQGRPFILAGHSQGAKAVVELLKLTVSDSEYDRMVAAYVFGFEIGAEELQSYPKLRPATGADDTGCVICYNSVSRPEAASSLFSRNAVCINPVNWTTDGAYAPASENPGSVFFDAQGNADTLFQTVGVRQEKHTLIVDGLDDEIFFIPEIGKLFPKGNYHVQEINLYFLSLQQNIAKRISRD